MQMQDAKIIIVCNFESKEIRSIRSFFSSRGFLLVITSTMNDLIQSCKKHAASLVCVNVFGNDTSWIHLITSMTIDPLAYEAPLLLVCKEVVPLLHGDQQKYYHFFQQQQHLFHYYLLTYPPSLQKVSEILQRVDAMTLPVLPCVRLSA